MSSIDTKKFVQQQHGKLYLHEASIYWGLGYLDIDNDSGDVASDVFNSFKNKKTIY